MTMKISILLFLINVLMIQPLLSQKLLFQSGFENGVSVNPPTPIGGEWKQVISGLDEESGYSWPQDLPAKTDFDAWWTYKVPDTENLEDYVEVKIDTTTGHLGNTTRALFMKIMNYDATNFDNTMQGHVRCEYRLNLSPDMNEAYIRYWMKLQPNLYEIMRFGTGRWRMIMEWFESGQTHSDYRWSVYLRTGREFPDSSSAHWRLVNEFQNGPGNPGDFEVDSTLNTQGLAPVDEWFKVEVYWKQRPDSTGHIWMSIDDNVIFDKKGPNMRDSFINNWQIFKLYTDEPSMDDGDVYQWIDDIEIWDTAPSGIITALQDKSIDKFQVMVYPNPGNKDIHFQLVNSDHSIYNLKVFDISGRKVWEYENLTSEGILKKGTLNPGTYTYLIVNVKTNKRISGKLIVQK